MSSLVKLQTKNIELKNENEMLKNKIDKLEKEINELKQSYKNQINDTKRIKKSVKNLSFIVASIIEESNSRVFVSQNTFQYIIENNIKIDRVDKTDGTVFRTFEY